MRYSRLRKRENDPLAKKTNSKPDATKTETPAAPAGVPATDAQKIAAAETRVISAADIVGEDNDKFPKRAGADIESEEPNDSHDEGAEPEALEGEPRNLGGRPKGSKDSYDRGRPARKDWADEPMGKVRPKPAAAAPSHEPEPEAPPAPEPAPRPPDYRALATFAIDMTTGGLTGLLGPHWKTMPAPGPGLPDEREMLIGHLTKYLEENEIKDIPPGAMLAIAVAGYAVPRVIQTIRMKRAGAPRQVRHEPARPAAKPAAVQSAQTMEQQAAETPGGRAGDGTPGRDFGPADEGGNPE